MLRRFCQPALTASSPGFTKSLFWFCWKIDFAFSFYFPDLHYTPLSIFVVPGPFPSSQPFQPSSQRPSNQSQRHDCNNNDTTNHNLTKSIILPDVEASSVGFPIVRLKICFLCAPLNYVEHYLEYKINAQLFPGDMSGFVTQLVSYWTRQNFKVANFSFVFPSKTTNLTNHCPTK